MSATNCDMTCASSAGGPGRYSGEHDAGRSTLGTEKKTKKIYDINYV